MGRHHEKVTVVSGRNPKECPNHGEPTDIRGDQPTYCLDCDRAVRATGNPCWRHVKPIPQAQIEAKQKREDEEAEQRKSFAERMHAKRKAKQEVKDAVAKLTPAEQLADPKTQNLVIKAIRKADKLRRKLGLKNKPRS